MKYLKTYENNIDKPKVGDFITLKEIDVSNLPDDKKEIATWFEDKIGQIKKININIGRHEKYYVYFDVPDEFNFSEDKSILIDINSIKYFSKNKEDVETFIVANKYNI